MKTLINASLAIATIAAVVSFVIPATAFVGLAAFGVWVVASCL